MSESVPESDQWIENIKVTTDHRENAKAVLEYFDQAILADEIGNDPVLDALRKDVDGLLLGIAQGTIKTGQPRIVEQLLRIVQSYPKEKDSSEIRTVIAHCAELGLSASEHRFPGVLRYSGRSESAVQDV